MQRFEAEDESEIWEAFKRDGSVEVSYGDDPEDFETFVGLMFGAEHEEGFYAGYKQADGSLSDFCNVPEHAFEAMFDNEPLPKGVEIEWNSSESSHSIEGADAKTISLLAAILTMNGFIGEDEHAPEKLAPIIAKLKKAEATTKLKSADHIDAINALVNEDDVVKTAVWRRYENDEDSDEVALPDRARSLGGGMVMIEQGRREWVPNGKKLYPSQEYFWDNLIRHWPRFPLKGATHWKRKYRRKNGAAIERRFDLFLYPIHAITREQDNKIVSISLIGTSNFDSGKIETILKSQSF